MIQNIKTIQRDGWIMTHDTIFDCGILRDSFNMRIEIAGVNAYNFPFQGEVVTADFLPTSNIVDSTSKYTDEQYERMFAEQKVLCEERMRGMHL